PDMADGMAHIITVGNEKGGSGKSTTALHLAVYLLHQGFSVATIDVDSRQQTLTRYVRNRRASADISGRDVLMPKHVHLPTACGGNLARLAHGAADTLITPINDSMIDLDVLARIDPRTGAPLEASPYTRNVHKARAERQKAGRDIDWVLVRNRISNLGSHNA